MKVDLYIGNVNRISCTVNLFITKSLGTEKLVLYIQILFYQGFKINKVQKEFGIMVKKNTSLYQECYCIRVCFKEVLKKKVHFCTISNSQLYQVPLLSPGAYTYIR